MAGPRDVVLEDTLDRYRAAIATRPDIELRGGRKLPHTSVNGYMYSSLTKDGRLGIRLSPADREAFIARYSAKPFVNYGASIAEHVEVPDTLLADPEQLGALLAMSRAYTLTIPPKTR
jgi:hypothetical protein